MGEWGLKAGLRSGRKGLGDGWTGGGDTMAEECLGPDMSGGGLGAHGEGGRKCKGDDVPGRRARPRPGGGCDISRVESRQPGVTPPYASLEQNTLLFSKAMDFSYS